MHKGRLEAFSDGVIAIIITIMVLELKVPHGEELRHLKPLIPVFLSYLLSFVFIAIYWNNHHHLLQAAQKVSGSILWANMHLLFWISLVPFVTAWMGENHFSSWPVAFYGIVQIMLAVSYFILSQILLKHHGKDSKLAQALGSDRKGKASLAIYALGVAATFFSPSVSLALYVFVAIMWLIPDRRIERALNARA